MRTLMPSMPLAWKAMVGLPSLSSSPMRVATISAMPDSLTPQVRSTRLRITAVWPVRRRRSGRMVPLNISRISLGTPGTA